MNTSDRLNEKEILTIEQATNTLWKWRKYRNQVFWSSVYRIGALSIALTIAPYLFPDLIEKLGPAVFTFPFLAFLFSAFGAYLLAVQYKLYKQVDRKFRSLLDIYKPEETPKDTIINRIFRTSFGIIIVGFFLFFGTVVQLLNGFVLSYLLERI